MTTPTIESVSPMPGPGQWLRERMWLIDLLIAVGVFLYNLPIVPAYAKDAVHTAGLIVVSAVLCVPYLWRRRFPAGVLGVMLLAACVQLVLGAPLLPADVILAFGLYNLASRHHWQVSALGAALTAGWLLIAVIPHLGKDVVDIGQLGVLLVVTLWVWTWGTLVRIRRQYVAGLHERAIQAERERETQARIAVADERARIAREIHDVVSHSLSVMVLMSDGAASKVDSEPARAKAAMVRVRDTGRSALADMRRMLGVLREEEPGSDAPQPGITQLGALVEQSRAAGLPVTLHTDGEPGQISDGLGLTVYRLVQESLTNARKHAGEMLTQVDVAISYRSHEVEVAITDDGVGTPETASEGGHGLLGMRERVLAHRGQLRAGPRKDGGFEVVAVLPRDERVSS